MDTEIKDLKIKAENEMLKVVEYLRKNENAFHSMDLKLHDVSYYIYTDMEEDFPLCYKNDTNDEYNYFCLFCEDNYNLFIEDLKESFNIDFDKIRVNIGRTSKFYLHNYIEFYNGNIHYTNSMLNILQEFENITCLEIVEDFKISISEYDLKNYKDDVILELEYIINEFYNDTVKHCKDCIITYGVLKDFKENQVEIFKEYLSYYEEELKEQKEIEEQEENSRLEALNKFSDIQKEIYNKYLINSEDLQKLL